MLPILIYEPDAASRLTLVDALHSLAEAEGNRIRIEASTDTLNAMQRAVESVRGVTAAMFCIPVDGAPACAALGNRLMEINSANYAVFYLQSTAMLPEIFEHCLRPAGILLRPFDERGFSACFRRILKDYEALRQPETNEDYLTIEANSTVYRLPFLDIHYIEALDKLVTIHTERQTITVRHTLAALSQSLNEGFLRCHRAYLVNAAQIEAVEYGQMQLRLKSGELLPLSRGQRNAVKEYFDGMKGGV